MKKLSLITIIALLSFGAAANNCNTIYCDSQIKVLYPHSNGNVYIVPEGDQQTKLDCKLASNGIILRSDNLRYDEMYSSLLSTFMSDMKIRMRVKTNTSTDPNNPDLCILDYLQMRRDI